MPPDPVLSRELQSLQQELSTAQRERLAASKPEPTAQTASGAASMHPAPLVSPEASAAEQHLRDQLGEFTDEVTRFFEEAEKNISRHPIESVVGALLIGILIGRLLGR